MGCSRGVSGSDSYVDKPIGVSADTAGEWSGHGLRLTAIELGTGKELWGVELLDRYFSVPLMP
jgi:hypothetical protein